MNKRYLIPLAMIFLALFILSQSKNNETNKFPYHNQTNPTYCGEAAIQMLLDYYNICPLPTQDEIAKDVNYNNTTEIKEMYRAFNNQTFNCKINKTVNYEDAYKGLIKLLKDKPAIILITWNNTSGHFLFVYGVEDGQIKYHDPANKPNQIISKEKLKIYWYDNRVANNYELICPLLIVNKIDTR